MAFRASASFDSTTSAVASFNITVPAGTVATDTIYILCGTASTTGTTHSASGFSAVGILGVALGTSGRVTLLEGTGHVAGDVIAVTCPASALTGALMVVYTNATTRNVTGTNPTSGTSATMVVPSVTTTQANEIVINFAVGLGSAARTVSTMSPGTSRATVATGGNTRFFAFGVSDQTIASPGASGTVTTTFSSTLLGDSGVQISHKPVAAAGFIGWGLSLS